MPGCVVAKWFDNPVYANKNMEYLVQENQIKQ